MIMKIDRTKGVNAMAPAWFKFWINDFLGGTSRMNSEEKGVYLELLLVQFQQGYVTMDDVERSTNASEKAVGYVLKNKFACLREDGQVRYFNRRMDEVREETYKHWETQKQNGLKGGRPPKEQKPMGSCGKTGGFSEKNPRGSGSGSGSVTKKKKGVPENVDEVRDYCESRGGKVDAEKFWDYYAAQGWQLANGRPMKDWQAAVRQWERRDAKPVSDYQQKHAEVVRKREERERQEAAIESRKEAQRLREAATASEFAHQVRLDLGKLEG